MDAYTYAELADAMDYLYDFFDQDLASRVRAERAFIPEGLESALADDSLLDFVWLWIKDPGPNGFVQYLRDGGFDEEEIRTAVAARRQEWAIDNPPHVAWFLADGNPVPVVD